MSGVILSEKLNNANKEFPWRVVIEGRRYATSETGLKQELLEGIREAAAALLGAEVVHVATVPHSGMRRPPVRGKRRQPKPAANAKDVAVRGMRMTKTGVSYDPRKRVVAALVGLQRKLNWPDSKLVEKFREHGLVSLAKLMGFWPASYAAEPEHAG